MVTLSNAENALKTVYLGTVSELLNTKVNPLMTKIQNTTVDVWGKEIRKAAKYGINGGVSAGDEDGLLPSSNSASYLQFVTTLKNLYGQIEITDKAIRASSDNRGAFTDLLNSELEDLLHASKFNLGRMLYGDGSSLLATFTVGEELKVDTTRNLIEGMVIDIYSPGGILTVVGAKIKAIDRKDNKLTLSSITYMGDGATIHVQGSRNKEITGLGAIFSDSETLYGIKRADYKFLNPTKKENVGALTDRVIQQVVDNLEINANSNIDFLACSNDVKYAYQDYLSQFKRNIDIMELNGGFKTLSFNGIPLVYDRFIEDGTMYILDTSAFKFHQLGDWRFLETESGNVLRQSNNKAVFIATLVKYCDLICDRPNGQAMLTGITSINDN